MKMRSQNFKKVMAPSDAGQLDDAVPSVADFQGTIRACSFSIGVSGPGQGNFLI